MMRARNWRVRGCAGSPSTCAGGPDSSTRPPSRKHHPVGDLAGEAHLVGGQHHRHALALEVADHRQHLADQLRVERRGDLVEQQQPREFTSARTIATRCCWPPESRSG